MPAVIYLAEHRSDAVAAEAMRQGAADFVVKSTVTSVDLRRSVRKAVAGVKRRRRGIAAHHKLNRARAQLIAAGEVQRMLLPERAPDVPGLDIAGDCFSADESGGDFYDFPKMLDGSVGIVMGDVSGHGLGPAILAADSRAYVRAFSRACNTLGQVLVQTNHLLCEDTGGVRFVTLFFACIHPRTRVMRVASAGHRAFLFDRHGLPTPLESQQPPLGLDRKLIRNFQTEVMLQSGELLLMMTDGITEAASTRNLPRSQATMFGDKRALEVVNDCRHMSSQEIVGQLLDAVSNFTKRREQDDDMTAVVVKVVDC
jgi:serine phosphatase RsbU (regulator of sigma subunit)